MRIFGPEMLRQFDQATGRATQKLHAATSIPLKNPLWKRASLFKRWLVKPAIVMALATYGLHKYNAYIQQQWMEPTMNLYNEKQRIYWGSLRQVFYLLLLHNRAPINQSPHPAVFYLDRMEELAKRLTHPPFTKEKILYQKVSSRIDFPFFKWKTTTNQRLILRNGDLAEKEFFCGLRLFGLPIFCTEKTKVVKKYRTLTMKKTVFSTIPLEELEELDIISDVVRLESWSGPLNIPSPTLVELTSRAQQLQQRFKVLCQKSRNNAL